MLWKPFLVSVGVLGGLSLQPLQPSARADIITFTDFQADMVSSIDPITGNEIISLLVNSTLFGPGGFAGGLGEVGSSPPDDSLWLVDPFLSSPPDDNRPAIGFILDESGNVMGIEPSPFRMFLGNPPDDSIPGDELTLIGLLDFSAVTGSTGSLNLSGVMVLAVDQNGDPTGEVFDVDPFTIQNIPAPGAVVLGVYGLALVSRRRVRG